MILRGIQTLALLLLFFIALALFAGSLFLAIDSVFAQPSILIQENPGSHPPRSWPLRLGGMAGFGAFSVCLGIATKLLGTALRKRFAAGAASLK